MSKIFRFQVWHPTGFVKVQAETKDEAKEKVEEYGLEDSSEGIEFDPYCDGQDWEIKDVED